MKNVFTFLLLLFSLLCNGQSPKLFTTDKELSSSLINQIYQDRIHLDCNRRWSEPL